jgi:hypothetical protein
MVYQFVDGNFTLMPGWPQRLTLYSSFQVRGGQPIVADVNGDKEQDIVVLYSGRDKGLDFQNIVQLLAFNKDGTLLEGFPKDLSAIAGPYSEQYSLAVNDIDLDGRNEIIFQGDDRYTTPIVYVYDLGGQDHGPILWGEYGKDRQNLNTVQIQN